MINSQESIANSDVYLALLAKMKSIYPIEDLHLEPYKDSQVLVVSTSKQKLYVLRQSTDANTKSNFFSEVKELNSIYLGFQVFIAFYDVKFNIFCYELSFDPMQL